MTVVVVLFCLRACYTEIKSKGIIPNVITLGLVSVGLFSKILLVAIDHIAIRDAAIIILWGTVLSFSLYRTGFLSPGSAKLLWGILLSLPSPLYMWKGNPLAILAPIINIFVSNALFLFVYVLYKALSKHRTAVFARISELRRVNLSKVLFETLFFFVFTFGIYRIFDLLELPLDSFLKLLIPFVLFLIIRKLLLEIFDSPYFGRYRYFLLIPILIFLEATTRTRLNFLLSMLGCGLVYMVLFQGLIGFMEQSQSVLSKDINVLDLEENMIPVERIVKMTDSSGRPKYEKIPIEASEEPDADQIVIALKPLSRENIEQLKDITKEGYFEHFGDQISVQRHLYFAPMACLGVIVTIICKGPFTSIL